MCYTIPSETYKEVIFHKWHHPKHKEVQYVNKTYEESMCKVTDLLARWLPALQYEILKTPVQDIQISIQIAYETP